MMAATTRGLHRLWGEPPWVFDDPLALVLVGPAWKGLRDELVDRLGDDLFQRTTALVVGRARCTEDRLMAGEFEQYVVLGAGLDSFAWRRPDALARGLRVFEVDHPTSQAWKLARVEALGLPQSDRHVFVPVDFEVDTVAVGLDRAGFDWRKRTFFSWLGVVPYLTVDAVEATLRSLARAGPGSEIALTYLIAESLMEDVGHTMLDRFGGLAAGVGEPFRTMWTPAEAEACARRCGLDVAAHPSRAEIEARYFAGRADGLAPFTFEQFLVAAVGGRAGPA